MKDKKLHKYTFEMSKLEFTNSLKMYINSSENKIFSFIKIISLKLYPYYFDLLEMKDRDKYIGKFDIEEENKTLIITGRYIIKENWMSSSVQPNIFIFFLTVLVPFILISEMIEKIDSKTFSIISLFITLIYIVIIPYKVFKFFSERKKKRQEEKLVNFQEDIENIFDFINRKRTK